MNGQTIYFNIEDQTLTAQPLPTELAARSIGYLKFKINFDSNWDELNIIAFFEMNKEIYYVKIDKEDGETYEIPYGVIRSPGFYIYVYGTDTAIEVDEDGRIIPTIKCKKRMTTNKISVQINPTGLIDGIYPETSSDEIVAIEQAELALKVAKEAYSIVWNMQYSLQKINDLLGGDPYALCKVETTIKDILKKVNGTQIKTDKYGVPQYDENGNYIFEEVSGD